MAQEADPDNRGDIDKVNKYCETVEDASGNITILPYIESGKYGWFDITHPLADPFPAQYVIGFLNQHWVQAALGVPVNFTMSSATVAHAFSGTGDHVKGGMLNDIAYVLESGIKVFDVRR